MIELVLTTIYFFLPAYIANMGPVLFKWLPIANKPISTKLFGAHKTYRGFLAGYIAAAITLFLQSQFSTPYDFLPYATFTAQTILVLAIPFGLGALLGDLLKSFFKRRLKIAPGRPFFPFDQLDFILVSGLSLYLTIGLPYPIFLTALLVTPVLHLLANVTAYFLGWKEVWW